MEGNGITITHECGYCGAKREYSQPDRHRELRKFLPENWVFSEYSGKLPEWFDDHGLAPARPQVFCSSEHSRLFRTGRDEAAKTARVEGNALATKLYRERLAALMMEGRGAVVALGELVKDEDG